MFYNNTTLQEDIPFNPYYNISLEEDKSFHSHVTTLSNVVRCFQVYGVPIISCFGILGSVFSCVVLLKTRLRKKFYSHFLVCISVSSGGFLSTVMTTWMNGQGVDVYSAPGLCQVVIFSSHFFPFLTFGSSVIGDYLILWDSLKPRQSTWRNSSGNAKCIVIACAVTGFTMYSYKTWTYGAIFVQGYRICSYLPENEIAMAILNVIDILFLLLVPSVLWLVFDILFLATKVSGKCKLLTSTYSKRHREVMKIVLTHSLSFHLFVTPRGVSMLVFIANRWMYGIFPTFCEMLTQQVFQFLFYTYFAFLPLFPLFTSEKFRLCFILLLGFRSARGRGSIYGIRRQPSFL